MSPAQLLAHFQRLAEAPEAVLRLRGFILDLAVRGKLVEQDPNEEPTPELLKRIELEKARRMKAGTIRKRESTPQLELEDHPFSLPRSWAWVRFGNIADFSAGRTPSRNDTSYWNTGDYPWVSIADMKSDVVATTKETVSEKAKNQLFRSEPSPVGTPIMSFKLTIGKISRLGVPAFHNEAIISIYPYLPDMDPYLFRVLPQFSQEGDTKNAIKGATLNRDSIAAITLPLPPLLEQHRIVAKVDELMALCDRLEAAQAERESRRDRLVAASLHGLNNGADGDAFREGARFHLHHLPQLATHVEHVEGLRRAIHCLAVRGRLVPHDQADQPAPSFGIETEVDGRRLQMVLPKGWSWARVGDVAEARLGKMLDKAKNSGTLLPYVRNTNVHWFDVRVDDLKQMRLGLEEVDRYLLRRGDVLICEGGHGIGRTAVWKRPERQIAFQKALHRVRPGKSLVSDFFSYCMFVYFNEGVLKTYFTGVGIPHFTGRALSEVVFPLPPLAEQHRIVAKVNELMTICDRLEAQLTTAQTESRRLLEAVLHEALASAA